MARRFAGPEARQRVAQPGERRQVRAGDGDAPPHERRELAGGVAQRRVGGEGAGGRLGRLARGELREQLARRGVGGVDGQGAAQGRRRALRASARPSASPAWKWRAPSSYQLSARSGVSRVGRAHAVSCSSTVEGAG
jgi:hypothetical protein